MLQLFTILMSYHQSQLQPSCIHLQCNISIAHVNAPVVYSTDVLSSKPVTTTMQPPTMQGLAPVNPDLQSSPEMLPEVKGTRVSKGF